jgi:hypothetical protein
MRRRCGARDLLMLLVLLDQPSVKNLRLINAKMNLIWPLFPGHANCRITNMWHSGQSTFNPAVCALIWLHTI